MRRRFIYSINPIVTKRFFLETRVRSNWANNIQNLPLQNKCLLNVKINIWKVEITYLKIEIEFQHLELNQIDNIFLSE